MTKPLSVLIFITLAAIAALHAYWGFGGVWPAATELDLINTVVGMPGMTEMFGIGLTLIVAGLIFAGGVVALLASGVINIGPTWFARLGAGVLTFVFLARGAMGYITPLLGVESTQPFASYDLLYYSPLCLILGVAFAYLTVKTRS